MLEGKQLILATREFAKEFRNKSWFYTISTLLILFLSLTCTILPVNIFIKIACSIFSGLMILRMFVIYHDYMHEAILQRSPLAKAIFTLFGLYVLAPSSIWKLSHNHHHKNNSKLYGASIGSYPIYSKIKYQKCSNREKLSYLFSRHPLTILFGYLFTFLYGMCYQSFASNYKKHRDSLFALVFHFGGQCILFFFLGWKAWLLFSIIPHFVCGALGAYLFYTQHNFPGVIFSGNAEWTYEGAALDSSSYLELKPFWRWVTANIGYHHIHHLNARIPFYRLAEVMASYSELQHPKKVSFKPRDIMACFRLKVWDHEKQQMTGIH
jgi:omega-6 fatty acid desaturase (delta-12 desaturase)